MPKKVMIFGSAGQLGVELAGVLNAREYYVTCLDRSTVDITDRRRVEDAVAGLDPAIVINAAAYNRVDVAEKEPQNAYVVNALAVRNIAVACRQVNALLVHFSTDYVFDGKSGRPYTEEDIPHPLGAYAVSKLAGELYAHAYLDRLLIVRTSGVFGIGALHTARGNFIELMLRLAAGGHAIRVVQDHIASPTYAPELASRTIDLVEKGQTGIFHIGGGTAISWFNYARLIFKTAGIEPPLEATNEKEYRTAARRPKCSALANAKMEEAGLAPMPALEDAVQRYFAARKDAVTAARA
jgi:dTDP-4-dehydrorhamnose reductase